MLVKYDIWYSRTMKCSVRSPVSAVFSYFSFNITPGIFFILKASFNQNPRNILVGSSGFPSRCFVTGLGLIKLTFKGQVLFLKLDDLNVFLDRRAFPLISVV